MVIHFCMQCPPGGFWVTVVFNLNWFSGVLNGPSKLRAPSKSSILRTRRVFRAMSALSKFIWATKH